MVEGQKMSKSLGNYFTLRDVLARGLRAGSHPLPAGVGALPQDAQLHVRRAEIRGHGHRPAAQFQAAPGDRPVTPRASNDAHGRAHRGRRRRPSATAWTTISIPPRRWRAVFEYVRDANSAMDAGEFRAGNVGRRARLAGALRLHFRRARSPPQQTRAIVRCGSGSADRGAHRGQEGPQFRARRPDSRAASGAGHHSGRHQDRRALEEEITVH